MFHEHEAWIHLKVSFLPDCLRGLFGSSLLERQFPTLLRCALSEELYRRINPDLWCEISVWDAAMHGNENAIEKPKKWHLEGQSVPPERFGGLVKWLPRSRAVDSFASTTSPANYKDDLREV